MPEVNAVHVNQVLTNIAIAYPMQGFEGSRLLADVSVPKNSGLYYIFDSARRALAQIDDNRAPGTEAKLVDFDVSTDSYACTGHALKSAVPDEEVAEADEPIRPKIQKTEFLLQRLLVNMEVRLKAAADAVLTTGAGRAVSLSDEWDDYTSGDPNTNIKNAILAVADGCGFRPNVCLMDEKVWFAVKDHPDVKERVLYGGSNGSPAEVLPAAFAALYGFDELIIARTQKNTAKKGQVASLSRVWGEDCYIVYRPQNPGREVPAFGYRFTWNAFDGSLMGWKVTDWRNNDRVSDMVQVEKHYDQKICLAAAGYRIGNCLS